MPEVPMVAPPDGGWGWVVCVACFMAHALTDGVTYSFGIIFVELLEYFNEKKANTALITSLCFGVCSLSGPINAAISNRFGNQKVVIFGTCIMVTNFIASIFAPNILFLYVTFGIAGWGYGMVILPSIVCLTKYFEKKRAFAVGLGVSGSGIGTFISSLLTRALIDAYTWKGTLLIQSGLILNCIVCGLVYLPLEHPVNKCNKRKCASKSSEGDGTDLCESIPLINKHEPTVSNMKDSFVVKERRKNEFYTPSLPIKEEITNGLNTSSTITITQSHRYKLDILSDNSSVLFSNECNSKECFFKNNLRQIEPVPFKVDRTEDAALTLDKTDQDTSSRIGGQHVMIGKKVFNFEVLTNRRMVLYMVSTFLSGLGFFVPYVYLPVKAEHSGIHSYAWLVSMIGIANAAGRVVFGFISDKRCVNKLMLYGTALVLCGLGTAVCPFLHTFETLLVYAAIYGLFSGVVISLTTVLISDFVGTDMLADAFGVRNFFSGIATLLGTPLAGWLFDITNSFTWTFAAGGIALTLAGVLMYAVPLIKVHPAGKSYIPLK